MGARVGGSALGRVGVWSGGRAGVLEYSERETADYCKERVPVCRFER